MPSRVQLHTRHEGGCLGGLELRLGGGTARSSGGTMHHCFCFTSQPISRSGGRQHSSSPKGDQRATGALAHQAPQAHNGGGFVQQHVQFAAAGGGGGSGSTGRWAAQGGRYAGAASFLLLHRHGYKGSCQPQHPAAHRNVCGSGSVTRPGVPGVVGGSGGTIQRCTSVRAPQRAMHSVCHKASSCSASCRPWDAASRLCMSAVLRCCKGWQQQGQARCQVKQKISGVGSRGGWISLLVLAPHPSLAPPCSP